MVEEDRKNSETAPEEEQSKQSYKDAVSSQEDGLNKEINNHLIDMIPREDMGLVPAQDVHFFYTRSHLSELQNCALLFSTNF